jgi:hypothetical protein
VSRSKHTNKTSVHYTLSIWGQCSEAMQAKIKSDKLYNDMQEVDDSLTLIKMIEGIAYKSLAIKLQIMMKRK